MQEIPYLLERREEAGMALIPVLLRPSPWRTVPWLNETQMLPRDGSSVSRDFKDDWDVVFAEVAEKILDIIDNPDYQPTVIERLADWTAGVLIHPGASIWTPWMSKNMPNIVEWMVWAGNILLWGFVIALLINARALTAKRD